MLRIAWNPTYVLPLPVNHRFPMSKYEILPEQLVHEGTVTSDNFFSPAVLEDRWLLEIHSSEYWHKLNTLSLTAKEERRTGFPLTRHLISRETTIAQGTLTCTRYALESGIAMNIAGGTHHAFRDRGEGFCLLNDIAIASAYLLGNSLARKILVIDLDVHQGNGTASIFQNDPRVFTFSMHGKSNYPMIKETSDLDIPLEDFTDDRFYLKTLSETLPALIDSVQPDFIFYQSGVDILETDRLGKLSVTRAGCKERDRLVFGHAHRNKIPVVASMGGGYSVDFKDIIEAHANTYRVAQEIFF